MSISDKLGFDLEEVPMDVFDLSASGLEIESLTGGHGLPENGASCLCSCHPCSVSS
jgi:hypothetical protein